MLVKLRMKASVKSSQLLMLHGGVGRGVLVRYVQKLVEGSRLVVEELVLEEGAFSASGCEVFDGLHLVHPLTGVAELGPTRQVVASGLGWALYAQGELSGLGSPLVGAGEVADESFGEI